MKSISEHDRFKNLQRFFAPEWKKNGTFIHEIKIFNREGDFWGQLVFTNLAVRSVHVVDAFALVLHWTLWVKHWVLWKNMGPLGTELGMGDN